MVVYNQDKARVSGCTRLDALLRSNFSLVVNDLEYSVEVPEQGTTVKYK